MFKHVPLYLTTVLSLLLVGCGKTPEALLEEAVAAEKTAQSALARNDSKAARRAADEAEEAVRRLKKLAALRIDHEKHDVP